MQIIETHRGLVEIQHGLVTVLTQSRPLKEWYLNNLDIRSYPKFAFERSIQQQMHYH